jgi:hypothetical protein
MVVLKWMLAVYSGFKVQLTISTRISGRGRQTAFAELRRTRNVLTQVQLSNNFLDLAAFC